MKVTVNIEYNSDDPQDLERAKNILDAEKHSSMLFEITHNLKRKFEDLADRMNAEPLLDAIMNEISDITEEYKN